MPGYQTQLRIRGRSTYWLNPMERCTRSAEHSERTASGPVGTALGQEKGLCCHSSLDTSEASVHGLLLDLPKPNSICSKRNDSLQRALSPCCKKPAKQWRQN